jgi:multiple sugar transport system substrate-binding protein
MNERDDLHKITRREFLISSAAVGAGLGLGMTGLSACAPQGAASGPVELSLWVLPWSDNFGSVTQDLLSKTFEKENPNIKVKVEEIPWKGVEEKYKTAFTGGKAPDVASSTVNRWPPLADMCALLPLDKYFTDGFKSKFVNPDVLEMSKFSGHYYAVPVLMENRSLFYNKDIFKEAGIAEAPKTLEEFLAACEKLKAIKKYGFGFPGIQRSFARFTFWLNLCGGSVFSADGTKCAINEPPAVEALSILVDMLKKGYMPEGVVGMTEEEVATLFTDGKTAMQHDGENQLVAFDKITGLNFDVAKSFTYKTPITYGGPEHYVIFKSSPHPEESWKLMEYMATNPQFSKERCEKFFYFPVAKGVSVDFKDPRTKVFEAQTETGVLDVAAHPKMDAATPIMVSAIQEALLGKATPQAAFDKAAKEVNDLLGQWKPGSC